MNLIKLRELNYFLSIMIIIVLFVPISAVNIIDYYRFIHSVSTDTMYNVSIQDVIIYIVYGLNRTSRTNLIDILRFSIPYLLITFFCGVYLSDLLDTSKKYLYLIRCKNYNKWLKNNLWKMLIIVISSFTAYYSILIVLAIIFIKNYSGFTAAFYILNPNYNYSGPSDFAVLLFWQFILSVILEFIVTIVLLLITLIIKDINKSVILVNLIILIFSFCGRYDLYNPFMLSKHKIINASFNIYPLETVVVSILVTLATYLFTVEAVKNAKKGSGI